MAETFSALSLKPLGGTDGDLCLRPSNNSVFSKLRKGAGAGLGAGVRQKTPAFAVAAPEPEQHRKPPGQIIRYGKEFLLQFMDRYVKCPMELQALQLEIVISEETERETQRQALKQVAEEDADDRDWRSRAPPPAAEAGGAAAGGGGGGGSGGNAGAGGGQQSGRQGGQQRQQQQQPQQQQQQQQQQAAGAQQQRQQPSQEAMRIHRAEEQGRQAYKVGGQVAASERALRAVKGILNKLTPEKYERLLGQLLEVVTNAELLKQTISLVFENAVAQPTFCAMYADLCADLGKELPSFPPAEGDTKPITFKRVLLNTCQDEFEAAEDARRDLANITEADERTLAEKRVKSRTLGTVRLIAELFRKDVVSETIILVCIRELLEAVPPKNTPPEENMEAACEMISITGKILASSPNEKSQKALDGYLARLTRLGNDDKGVASRIRFLIRDVLDMKKNKWVPRRETFTAKKLEEVRAEAEADLGMVSSKIAADLPALPGQIRATAYEFALLPPLRGGDMGWEYVGRKGGSRNTFGPGSNSALIGDYRPPEPLVRQQQAAAAAVPEPAAAAPATAGRGGAAAAKPKAKPVSGEDIVNRTKGFLREYLSVGDLKEARLCLSELREAPKADEGAKDLRGVISAGVEELFDAQSDKAITSLLDLLVGFVRDGLLTKGEVVGGLQPSTSGLGDLALDVPKAPELLGRLVGGAAAACSSSSGGGSFSLSELSDLLQGAEGAEAKRAFATATFNAYAAGAGGEAQLAEAVKAAGLKGEELFAADEFDGDLPSVADWLKADGFAALSLA